jgi:trans-feruloyl-CoA hydratase/vanillin synthase
MTEMTKTYETILIEKQDGITWVIFNRPEKRNAMSPQMHFDMDDALTVLAQDAETRVLILTGAGASFSAGQDLKLYFREMADDPEGRARAQHASNQWRWHRLTNFPKPTIAMINGHCFGGAFTQVCACDIAISSDDAQFGLSEVNWGVIPGGIVSWNVAEILSYRDALYYAMTGLPFNGKKAAEIRLVNYSVPGARLREETVSLAKLLMEKNPNTLRFTKEAIRTVKGMAHDQAHQYLATKLQALQGLDKDAHKKGIAQFLDEKSYRPGMESYKA